MEMGVVDALVRHAGLEGELGLLVTSIELLELLRPWDDVVGLKHL